jgi:hypothetical protein
MGKNRQETQEKFSHDKILMKSISLVLDLAFSILFAVLVALVVPLSVFGLVPSTTVAFSFIDFVGLC